MKSSRSKMAGAWLRSIFPPSSRMEKRTSPPLACQCRRAHRRETALLRLDGQSGDGAVDARIGQRFGLRVLDEITGEVNLRSRVGAENAGEQASSSKVHNTISSAIPPSPFDCDRFAVDQRSRSSSGVIVRSRERSSCVTCARLVGAADDPRRDQHQ